MAKRIVTIRGRQPELAPVSDFGAIVRNGALKNIRCSDLLVGDLILCGNGSSKKRLVRRAMKTEIIELRPVVKIQEVN